MVCRSPFDAGRYINTLFGVESCGHVGTSSRDLRNDTLILFVGLAFWKRIKNQHGEFISLHVITSLQLE